MRTTERSGLGRIAGILRSIRRRHGVYRFLTEAIGVVHVGANTGQERGLYDQYGLNVLWIEPIPELFSVLEANIRMLPRQAARCRLVADKDGGR